ncbi:MAG: phosphoesterase, partial [Gemmatimonadota bacterium]|nr:phosphoesterase [Gemmatimonadota bacterium]
MNRHRQVYRAATAAAAFLIIALSAATSARGTPQVSAPIKPGHIFIILLENESYARTFSPKSLAPYLAHELSAKGALLRSYYGIGHNSLD